MSLGDLAIIPVIDIRGGLVVRARAGERAAYQPIETPLAPSPDPVAVAEGLLGAVPSRRLYVADLDAIETQLPQNTVLTRLRRAFPGHEIWVDAGFADEDAVARFLDRGIGRPVLGTESLRETSLPVRYRADAILSLDSRGDALLGPPELHAEPALWPDDVIAMTLTRVGAELGPDLKRVREVKARSPTTRIYAAGGLRGPEDLALLAAAGAAGILVASAIHDGRLRQGHAGDRAAV
ncbi:HisA/HisF-related TIM barrel protein [Enterovirga sp. CN4-39]|uniref:HisA/HisF-related TIM barrel protein n=1 Tax=Enterovirga sp. CN4-39 TaxID=3400910 RepID=UPI003C0F54A8